MSEGKRPVEVLEAQIMALQDTHRNVTGLIEKLTRVRSELDEMELERNRRRNEE